MIEEHGGGRLLNSWQHEVARETERGTKRGGRREDRGQERTLPSHAHGDFLPFDNVPPLNT